MSSPIGAGELGCWRRSRIDSRADWNRRTSREPWRWSLTDTACSACPARAFGHPAPADGRVPDTTRYARPSAALPCPPPTWSRGSGAADASSDQSTQSPYRWTTIGRQRPAADDAERCPDGVLHPSQALGINPHAYPPSQDLLDRSSCATAPSAYAARTDRKTAPGSISFTWSRCCSAPAPQSLTRRGSDRLPPCVALLVVGGSPRGIDGDIHTARTLGGRKGSTKQRAEEIEEALQWIALRGGFERLTLTR